MGAKVQGVVSNTTKRNAVYIISNHYLKIDFQKVTHSRKVNGTVEG
jgi:hypothetical protein